MKRIRILLMGATLLFASCNTVNKTARTAETLDNLRSATVVDIVPATESRITHTLYPDASLLRGGEGNVRQAVEHEALVKYGNADILLEPQYIVEKERRLFRTKITSITVSGRPAYYTNYRALHDSVWANPVFNGLCCPPVHNGQCCHHEGLCDHPAFDALDCPPYMRHHSHAGGNGSGFRGIGKTGSRTSSGTPAYRGKGFVKSLAPFIGGEDGSGIFCVLFNLGYQFNPYINVGAGIGLDFYGDGLDDVPLYLDIRFNFSKKEKGFFFDYKVGADIYDGDPMLGFAVGYDFGKMDIAFQSLNYSGSYYDSYTGESYYESEFGVSASFRF